MASNLEKRLERVNRMEKGDASRFKPNPRGPGFLTRSDRYRELRWEIKGRMAGNSYKKGGRYGQGGVGAQRVAKSKRGGGSSSGSGRGG